MNEDARILQSPQASQPCLEKGFAESPTPVFFPPALTAGRMARYCRADLRAWRIWVRMRQRPEGMQLGVDRFQAAVWWYATVKKGILCIADGGQPPTSNGGNDHDFSG